MLIPQFQGTKILIGVTGSIAAYKSAELIRLLKEGGAEVRVVMTEGASAFITPLTLQTLAGQRVYQHLLDHETEATMSHIELARWADLILITPASANFLAKLSAGFADDLLSTLCLATSAPIKIVPAMNTQMWLNAATQVNVRQLRARNIEVLEPAVGMQACGEMGPGRMIEPVAIINHLINTEIHAQRLNGKRIVITAGPTQEPIDPVRYISNYSSGKMGYAIAAAAALSGAQVTLISGPTHLDCPRKVERINVVTAQEMFDAALENCALNCDIFIAAAAVADYRAATMSKHKIKKKAAMLSLDLLPNPDILVAVAQLTRRPMLIGFAAETDNIIANAQQKLREKKLDIIVANQVGMGKGFQVDDNELFVITVHEMRQLALAPKTELAYSLIDIIVAELERKNFTAPYLQSESFSVILR